MGTAIPFIKFMCGGKNAEEHTLKAKGYANCETRKIVSCVNIQNVRYLL